MRKIAAALIVVATLVVALLFLLPLLISTDWARSELGRQLSSASGMDIRLEGPVRLSFLPGLAVVARDIGISTEAGDLSVKVPGFSTAITLSSLWSDRLEIRSIALVGPVITVKPPAVAKTAEPASAGQSKGDPFAALVTTLERLAVNRITIENGSLTIVDEAGAASTVGAIDADLKAPDLDGEVAFSLSATRDDRRVQLNGRLSALRPILQHQPAQIALDAEIKPAPSPLLASLKASGEIRLNENGSYQIRGGQFDLGGQALRMDALFLPGQRPRFLADLSAKRVDIGTLMAAGDGGASGEGASAGAGEPSLAMLAAFDADVSVTVDQLVSGALAASDVQVAATLRNGRLEAKLEHLGLDAGTVAASVSTDVTEASPAFQGKVASSGLDIGALAKLVGQAVPLAGKVTMDTAFAFRGMTPARMRESLNLRGTVGIRQGKVPLAALADAKGGTVGDITGLTLDAKIQDIAKPVDVAGKLTWQGQEVAFKSQLAPADFLAGASAAQASGPVSLSVASKYLGASATGRVGAGGTFKGQVSATSPSLDKLLRWLGQGGSPGLRDFAFDGAVDAGPQGVSFTKAKVGLNGVRASGEGAVKLGTPLDIRTSLSFAKLDFAALTSGTNGTATGSKGPAGSGDAPIDLSFLKGLDAKIDVEADKIGYGKVFAGPVKTTLVVADGTAALTVPQSPFYGGTVAATMSADGSGDVPAIKLGMAIAGAAAAPLLRDAAEFDRLEGRLDTNVAVSGAGKTSKALRRSLDGKASVKFSDGALRGIDIAEVYNNLVGLLASGFKPDEGKKTTFTELGASFSIGNGIAQTNDISLLGPLVRMDGAGRIDLAEQTLEIKLNPRIVASLSGQGGDIATKGIGVPVIVDGSLSAPRIYPDLSKLLQDPKGALEMLNRFGLPTEKLGLDKLLPGQAGSGEAGKGAADLIGDLIRGDGSETGRQDPAKPSSAEDAAKAIIGDLLKSKAAKQVPSTGGVATDAENTAETPDSAAQQPETSKEDGIGSLLDQFLR
ncbi:AsmA family protein [Ollibium composti]|uniref:AsmA family protein n=1 Tax=Ollibium composti TaxID=2675109 RepID=A0ABY2Q1P4_9HYPH|nr:AsmA family protein [Mesorhizobium composti]THF54807.1 AsmA family protein [Mesorhizobium composti]